MSHSTEELLFAVQVRKLAVALQDNEYTLAHKTWKASQPALEGRRYNPRTEEEHAINMKHAERVEAEREFEHKWYLEHRIKSYTKQALDLINEVADEIQQLRM